MADKVRSSSSRHQVMTFAACIAHWLNADRNGQVEIQAFELYLKISKLLSEPNGSYAGLCGQGVIVDQISEEIANTYLDYVLDRRLFLAGTSHLHKGHQLFEALCRRGISPGWSQAEVKRAPSDPNRSGSPPPDFPDVSDRLKALPADISKGNPAKNTRDTHGALCVHVPGATQEIAEEMSLWGAIKSAPSKLRQLTDQQEFNEFCSLVIKAVETANAHYGALVSLGLSPVDWRELSIDTAKKASAFRSAVRLAAEQTNRSFETIEVWMEIWERRQVPGFDSAQHFWESDLGKALRHSAVYTLVGADEQPDLVDPDRENNLLDTLSFERMVEVGERDSIITAFDAKLLRGLMAGLSLDQLASPAESKSHLKGRDLGDYLIDLSQHIRAHAEAMFLQGRDRVREINSDKN